MTDIDFSKAVLKELEAEIPATRKCIERIPEQLYDWKPHEKSMNLGYLTLLVADIPRWISYMLEQGDIDFATFGQFQLSTNAALLAHFDENIEGTMQALKEVKEGSLDRTFSLKNHGQVLYTSPLKENIESTINHMVHHRGQLTVYMRLNNIAVPSIYGPSADDRSF